MQTNATLLANNSQHCWMLHLYVASACTPCWMLLGAGPNIVGSCCIRLHTTANNSQHSWPYNVGSCCIRLHTTANNSQHSWPNNVGSCCVRLHLALGTKLQICKFPLSCNSRQRLEHKENQTKNRKMTRKPWSYVRLSNLGYWSFTTKRILVLRNFISMIPPRSISEL